MNKKRVFLSIILINFFDLVYAENALSCGSYKNIPVGLPGFFRGIMTVIKYVVPLLLILFASMDIVRILYSPKKNNMDILVNNIIVKFVAAVSIFFIVVLVQLLVKEASGDSDLALCISCFTVDSNYCSSYEIDVDDSSSEKSVADAEREALEQEREEKRKEAEEKANDAKKIAEEDNDPKSIRDGSSSSGGNVNGRIESPLLYDNFVTSDWSEFIVEGNPFSMPQCTYFAWSRFYQVYGYDSGARGNGKTNAQEIVDAHPDKFKLSDTPASGSVFSANQGTTWPQYGHVGFVEQYDGTYLYISEGNVTINGSSGNIWIHKTTWASFKAQYPDIVFAVPI